MVAERGHAQEPSAEKAVGSRCGRWRTMTSVEQQENVSCNEQSATHATEYVAKAGTELREIRDGIFAPMDTNLNPAANTGEPKVFYKTELIPKWLNVVRGVVDSEDLPLNVYRETLLRNKILRVIKKNHVTKYLEILAEIAELNDAYKKFYEQFVKCVKLGIHENSVDGVEIAELLRFNTSKFGDEQISLKEYVDRMKEGQNDIFYITGESIAVVPSYPFLENLRKKGLEMHYIVDPADEHTVQQVKEFDGKMLKSTTKEGLDLGEELKTEFEPLKKLMNEVLGGKVEEMIVSNRMIDSLRVFTTSWHGLSANMERIMKARHDSMHLASGSQQQVEGGEWETVVGKRRKKGEREEKRGRQEKVGTLEGKEGERDQEGRKSEEEREAQEGGGEQVEEDVTGWTEVTRKKRRKMVQIFVKMNESKVIPMEVSLEDDKVEDVMRQIQKDEDAYVTLHGRVLKRSDKLKSCGVTDGCTIQVTNRLRGGGRHKVKKSKESAKTERMEHRVDQKDDEVEGVVMDLTQSRGERLEQRWAEDVKGDKTPVMRECDKDAYVQMIEQEEAYRKIVDEMWGGNDFEVEWLVQQYMRINRETLEWTQEQAEMMGCAIRWAVEARKKGRGPEKEQRRREEPLEEMRTESTDEPEVTGRFAEVKTGRGSASLVQGEADGRDELDETRGKGKGKGNGGKGEHGGKGNKAGKGFQQSAKMMKGEEEQRSEENETQKELKGEEEQETAEEDGGRVRMAPNMGAGGSHPQAMTDPEEKQRQGGQWVLRPMRKWADCVDEEPEEEAEEEDKHEAENEREEKEAEERVSRGSEGREEEVKGGEIGEKDR